VRGLPDDADEKKYAAIALESAVHAVQAARQPRDPATGRYVGSGFDGGVSRKAGRPTPGTQSESPTALMQRAFQVSREQRQAQKA
jgi:hypothetical protein